MTAADFQNSEYRADLRDLLLSPAFVLAKQLILEKLQGVDVRIDAPEVASARLLSTRCGYELAFADLTALSQVPPEPEPEPQDDFGAEPPPT